MARHHVRVTCGSPGPTLSGHQVRGRVRASPFAEAIDTMLCTSESRRRVRVKSSSLKCDPDPDGSFQLLNVIMHILCPLLGAAPQLPRSNTAFSCCSNNCYFLLPEGVLVALSGYLGRTRRVVCPRCLRALTSAVSERCRTLVSLSAINYHHHPTISHNINL